MQPKRQQKFFVREPSYYQYSMLLSMITFVPFWMFLLAWTTNTNKAHTFHSTIVVSAFTGLVGTKKRIIVQTRNDEQSSSLSIGSTNFFSKTIATTTKFGGSSSTTALLGIKGFRSWFESQFPDSIVEIPYANRRIPKKKKNSSSSSSTRRQQQQLASTTPHTNHQFHNNIQSFDHVCIDMNQLIHQVMRRSISNEHGLELLIQELNLLLTQVVIAKQSIVLAMDGTPPCAKIMTQRLRRYKTVQKIIKVKQALQKHKKKTTIITTSTTTTANDNHNSNHNDDNDNNKKRRIYNSQNTKFKRQQQRLDADKRTLGITPGTTFMMQVEQALLYWAYQRLSVSSKKATTTNEGGGDHNTNNNVTIYISSSIVPGEGEIKLLEWIYNHMNPNHRSNNTITTACTTNTSSIALIGGDSDLVLEGFMIHPILYTPNVFVVLPDDEKKRYIRINVWQTTCTMVDRLVKSAIEDGIHNKNGVGMEQQQQQQQQIRTDFTFIVLLNGNDYLPNLRGSSGFHKLFRTYMKLFHRHQLQQGHDCSPSSSGCFALVDPITLEYNVPNCIEYFYQLELISPPSQFWLQADLRNMNNSEKEDDWNDDDDGISSEDDEEEDVDNDEYEYSNEHYNGSSDVDDLDDGVTLEEHEEENGEGTSIGGTTTTTRTTKVKANMGRYLYGLLWNLHMYQQGVCIDYSYNYGNCLAPTAQNVKEYFIRYAAAEATIQQHPQQHPVRLGLQDLRSVVGTSTATDTTTTTTTTTTSRSDRRLTNRQQTFPVSAALSCLLAVPVLVKDEFVLPPYRSLSNEIIQTLYKHCIHPIDGWFDIKLFETLVSVQTSSVTTNDIHSPPNNRNNSCSSGCNNHTNGRSTNHQANHNPEIFSADAPMDYYEYLRTTKISSPSPSKKPIDSSIPNSSTSSPSKKQRTKSKVPKYYWTALTTTPFDVHPNNNKPSLMNSTRTSGTRKMKTRTIHPPHPYTKRIHVLPQKDCIAIRRVPAGVVGSVHDVLRTPIDNTNTNHKSNYSENTKPMETLTIEGRTPQGNTTTTSSENARRTTTATGSSNRNTVSSFVTADMESSRSPIMIPTTQDGILPLVVVKQLSDTKLISEIKWEMNMISINNNNNNTTSCMVVESLDPTSRSNQYEWIRLNVHLPTLHSNNAKTTTTSNNATKTTTTTANGSNIVLQYEYYRHIQQESRKTVQHYLAAMVLNDLFDSMAREDTTSTGTVTATTPSSSLSSVVLTNQFAPMSATATTAISTATSNSSTSSNGWWTMSYKEIHSCLFAFVMSTKPLPNQQNTFTSYIEEKEKRDRE